MKKKHTWGTRRVHVSSPVVVVISIAAAVAPMVSGWWSRWLWSGAPVVVEVVVVEAVVVEVVVVEVVVVEAVVVEVVVVEVVVVEVVVVEVVVVEVMVVVEERESAGNVSLFQHDKYRVM